VVVAAAAVLTSHTVLEVEPKPAQLTARTNVVGAEVIEVDLEETVADSVEVAVLRLKLKFIGAHPSNGLPALFIP
jgi:hypothetical protein